MYDEVFGGDVKVRRQTEKSFTANIVIIFTAQLVVKLFGMLYRMVITNIDGFGDAGNGFYSAGFQIYTLLLAISSIGIPNAVSKLISERAVLSDFDGANRIFRTSVFVFAAIGILLSGALLVFSRPVAKYVLHMDGAEYTLTALAPSIFFVCVSSVFRGYFSGINKLNVMSLSQVAEQLFKSVLTIAFVLLAAGQAPEVMAGRANFATTAATAIGTVYLFCAYRADNYRHNFKAKCAAKKIFHTIKSILIFAVPISLCSVISAINRIVDTATITRGIDNAFALCIPARGAAGAVYNPTAAQLSAEAVRLAGMLSKSDTLINLPTALNVSFATVLVPFVSRCMTVGDKAQIKKYVNFSILTSVVFVLPCAIGYVVLAKPIYNLIYPNAALGCELLQLSAASLVFTALNQTLTGALQGMGKVYIPAAALAVGCVVKIVLNYILISVPQINICGAVIGSTVCQFIVFIAEWRGICKYAGGEIVEKSALVKTLFCNALMCIVTYCTYKISHSVCSNAVSLMLAIGISVISYAAFIILFKVFEAELLLKIPFLSRVCAFFEKKHIRN